MKPLLIIAAAILAGCGSQDQQPETLTPPPIIAPAAVNFYEVDCAPVIYQNSGVSLGVSMRVTNSNGAPIEEETLSLKCDELPEYSAKISKPGPMHGASLRLFIGIFSDNLKDEKRTYRAKNKHGKEWAFSVQFQRTKSA